MSNGVNKSNGAVISGKIAVHDAVLVAQETKIVVAIGLRLHFMRIRRFRKMLEYIAFGSIVVKEKVVV